MRLASSFIVAAIAFPASALDAPRTARWARDLVSVSASAPAPTRGVVVDGTYVRTAYKTHLGSNGVVTPGAAAITIQLAGPAVQTLRTDGKGKQERRTEHFAVSGADFQVTHGACSAPSFTVPAMPQGKYTAAPTSLTTYQSSAGGTTEEVFTRK